MLYKYKYPHPAVTVDCVIFGLDEGEEPKILLIKRSKEPFKGDWALPGGFVNIDENLEQAAQRELQEETGITKVALEQLYTFGEVDRDPRERIISVAYSGLVRIADQPLKSSSDAAAADWFPLDYIPSLAFDHRKIIKMALSRLKPKTNE